MYNELRDACKEMRKAGIKGRLRVVPVINKHCFVPCGMGKCNCHKVVGQFTLVEDQYYEASMKEYLTEMVYFQNDVDKFLTDFDYKETKIVLEKPEIKKHSGARS